MFKSLFFHLCRLHIESFITVTERNGQDSGSLVQTSAPKGLRKLRLICRKAIPPFLYSLFLGQLSFLG